jgi:pilus assembly protein FimV
MLRFPAPTLLAMSLGLPGAASALGLGDIHVESALHQPLAAQIDLIAATHEDLAGLSAGIPDLDTFRRYGLDRPAFLSTTVLKVSQDSQGRPVLTLRSHEAFSEPLVTFLVDLHSPHGELIREYTVLLDPPGLVPEHGLESRAATPVPQPAVAQTPALVTTPKRAVTVPEVQPSGHTYTVAPRDTLDRIVSKAGAHSRSDRHRMMIAIFRANPGAFQANLNMLRTGAMLRYPTAAELSAISAQEASHEFASQMAAWHAPDRRTTAAAPVITEPVADPKPEGMARVTDSSELTQRVASLEKSIDELKRDLKQPLVEPAHVAVAVKAAPVAVSIELPQTAEEPAPAPPRRGTLFAALACGLGLVLAGAWFHRRRRTSDNRAIERKVEQDAIIRRDAMVSDRLPGVDRSPGRATQQQRPVESGKALPPLKQAVSSASYLVEEGRDAAGPAGSDPVRGESNWFKDFGLPGMGDLSPDASPADSTAAHTLDGTTAVVPIPDVEVSDDTVAHRLALFNPEDEPNTAHVVIASGLNQPPPFVERRKNPADVLRQAIEREPDRSDLRLKLLELYYTAAAQNRRAFLEVTRQLTRNEKLASAQEWSRIADMGRIIAPDDELFSGSLDDKAA